MRTGEYLIVARDKARYYRPMEHPGLPFELMKVQNGDVKAAQRFVSRFGGLGHHEIRLAEIMRAMGGQSIRQAEAEGGQSIRQAGTRGEALPGVDRQNPIDTRPLEPLEFIWSHATQLRLLFSTYEALKADDEAVVQRVVQEFTTTEPLVEDRKLYIQTWLSRGIEHGEPLYDLIGATAEYMEEWGNRLLASKWLMSVCTSNLTDFTPIVDYVDQPARFVVSYKWAFLLNVVYWHAAAVFTRSGEIAICRECGHSFEKTDRRQQFCPPDLEQREEYRFGLRSRAQSRCAMRYRARKSRRDPKPKEGQ